MPNVTVKLKDGTVRTFVEKGRPGGSYYNVVDYKESFVIVTDEWGTRTAFPAGDVAEVVEEAKPERW